MEAGAKALTLGEHVLTLDPRPRGKVSVELESLTRHACILGTTGSGKSTCAAVLAGELAKAQIATTILDRTGEYVQLLASLNPTVLKPGESLVVLPFDHRDGYLEERIEEWVSLLDHFSHVSYGVGFSPLQNRVVREIFDAYFHGTKRPLTLDDLLGKLWDYERETDAQRLKGWAESIEALISRLWPLTVGVVGATLNQAHGTFDVEQLFKPGLSLIDLSCLPDDRAKNLLSQIVLKEVYEATRKRGLTDSITLVMLIDEAQHLAPNEKEYISIPERCAIELRKYGFCLITCATRPSLISPNIIANSNTLICHMLNNQLDIEMAAGFFIGSNVKDALRRLPVGEAMLQVNHPQPKDAVRVRIGTTGQRATLFLHPKNLEPRVIEASNPSPSSQGMGCLGPVYGSAPNSLKKAMPA